jgi:hypothetical protein
MRQSGLASDIRKDRQVRGGIDYARRSVDLPPCTAHQDSDDGEKAQALAALTLQEMTARHRGPMI